MPSKTQILIIETDKTATQGLIGTLRDAGYETSAASDGPAVFEALQHICPDAILVDQNFAAQNELLKELRGDSPSATSAPVMLLTPRGQEAEALALVETGADDFVLKPVRGAEILARLQMVLSRTASEKPTRAVALRAGPIFLNFERKEAFLRGESGGTIPLKLTRREFALLHALMARKNQMMTRQQIVDEAFGGLASIDPANLGAYIHRLREKVEANPSEPRHIVTDRGLGFKIVD